MHQQYRFFILSFCCLVASFVQAHAQPGDQQINTWIKELAAKKDPGEKRIELVYRDFLKLDSSTRCQAIERIRTAAQRESIRCQIRVRILQNSLIGTGLNCPEDPSELSNAQEALQDAYEIEDEALQYDLHLDLGQKYNGMRQYGLATMHFHMLFDVLRRNNREDFFLPSGAFYDMSFSLYHTHEYAGCISNGLNALHALPNARFQPDDTLNTYQKMLQWNTIGLAYHKIQKYDSAFLAFNHAEEFAKRNNNPFW